MSVHNPVLIGRGTAVIFKTWLGSMVHNRWSLMGRIKLPRHTLMGKQLVINIMHKYDRQKVPRFAFTQLR